MTIWTSTNFQDKEEYDKFKENSGEEDENDEDGEEARKTSFDGTELGAEDGEDAL